MRPIDADALKEVLKECAYSNDGVNTWILKDEVLGMIDNAPTVFDCSSCKNNGNERECIDCHGYSNYVHYEEKLQGGWVRKEDIIHLLERWAERYYYIEIPTDDAIKAIKEFTGGAE